MVWLHPMLVHFAIGLLLAAVVFDVLGLALTNEKLTFAGFWNALAGALAALLAVATGLYSEAHLGPHAALGDALLGVHKLFGLIVLGLSVGLAVWRIAMRGYVLPRRRTLYLTGAFFAGLLVVVTGGVGGALVYLYGLGLPPDAAQKVIDAQPKGEAPKVAAQPVAPPPAPGPKTPAAP